MSAAAFQRIKEDGTLPSPAGTALKILELADNRDTTIDEITVVVESDPGLASQLLRLVNSPVSGLSQEIGSVSRAVSLLGLQTVKGVALGFSLIASGRRGDCVEFDYDAFWSESSARAVSARHVAGKLTDVAADEAFTCGLLCQIGRLAFASVYPQSYSAAIQSASRGDSGSLVDIERAMFQIDHNELGAAMMDDWHIPGTLCDAVRHQDAEDLSEVDPASAALADLLRFGGVVSLLLTQSRVQRASLSLLVITANRIGIRPDVVYQVFDSINDEWRMMGEVLAVSTRRVPLLAEMYRFAT